MPHRPQQREARAEFPRMFGRLIRKDNRTTASLFKGRLCSRQTRELVTQGVPPGSL